LERRGKKGKVLRKDAERRRKSRHLKEGNQVKKKKKDLPCKPYPHESRGTTKTGERTIRGEVRSLEVYEKTSHRREKKKGKGPLLEGQRGKITFTFNHKSPVNESDVVKFEPKKK